MAKVNKGVQESVISAALQVAGASGVIVRIDGRGICHLSGTVRDAKEAESVLSMVENAGVEEIELSWSVVAAVETVVDQQTYRVQADESWWDIAVRFYGDGKRRQQLQAANGDVDTPKAGDVVLIPQLPN